MWSGVLTTVVPTEHATDVEVAQKDVEVEAPVTFSAYLVCAFAAFGGIYFGYVSCPSCDTV